VQAVKLQQKHGRYHKVRPGETLSSIAVSYGISVKRLAHLNRISAKTKIRAGRRIRVR
jgi:LysM repeat protein